MPYHFRSAIFKFIFPGERRLPVDSVSCISNNLVGKFSSLHLQCISDTFAHFEIFSAFDHKPRF